MEQVAALKLAIDLLHAPFQVRSLRSAPLPDDVIQLVRIAGGDRQATKEAAALMNRSPEVVREAASFFVEQVMLYPGADAYRVLGVRPEAAYAELRRNMAFLLRWLHPDGHQHGERAVFASRVTQAWDRLKTKDRRAAYDRSRQRSSSAKKVSRHRQGQRSSGSRLSGQPGSSPKKFASRRSRSKPLNPMRANQNLGLLQRLLMMLFGRRMV